MKDIQLTEHFKLSEFVSNNGEPTDVEIGHLRLLCTFILEPLRINWGSGIKVTSGYRSPAYNTLIGGSKTSAHVLGYAVDIKPTNGNIAAFKKFVKTKLCDFCEWKDEKGYHKAYDYAFDQCIDEKKGSSEWIHIGLMNSKGEMRRQFLKTTDGKIYTVDKV